MSILKYAAASLVCGLIIFFAHPTMLHSSIVVRAEGEGVMVANAADVEVAINNYNQERKQQIVGQNKLIGTKVNTNYTGKYNPCSCVSYAKSAAGINVGSVGYAKNHPINTQTPIAGAIVVMRASSSSGYRTGHLAVVKEVLGDTILITEANWVRCKVTTRLLAINTSYITGYYVQ